MKNNILIYALSVALLIVASSVGYYLVVYIPKRDQEKQQSIERAAQEETRAKSEAQLQKERDYNSCVSSAYISHSSWWDSSCESQGLEKDCRLPSYEADTINDTLQKDKDRCLQLYKTD